MVDDRSLESYYHILGVQPNASQDVLDAAYRRQVRLHTGENLDDSVLIAGSEKSDPFLAKLDEAYRLLSNPLKRWTHDEELKEAQLVPLTEEELEVARKRIEPPDAWLSYQRREHGWIYVRVGWAADFTAIHDAVNSAIPESGRAYNARLNEWRVDPRYETELAAIFTNFERADVRRPPRLAGPTYQGPAAIPPPQHIPQAWRGWPFLIIGGLVLAIIGAVLFPANRRVPVSAQATATSLDLISSYEPLESNFDTAASGTLSGLKGTLLHPSVNLRERPEAAGPVLKLLGSDQTYRVIGRLEDNSWYVVTTGDLTGWIAAWTIAVDGEPENLPVFGENELLPGAAEAGGTDGGSE
jgi:curved DNA-binding protein CbpA